MNLDLGTYHILELELMINHQVVKPEDEEKYLNEQKERCDPIFVL